MSEWISTNKRVRPVFKGAWSRQLSYLILDVVTDAATASAYAALKNVPAGVLLTNSDYWVPVIDGSDILKTIESARTAADAANDNALAVQQQLRQVADNTLDAVHELISPTLNEELAYAVVDALGRLALGIQKNAHALLPGGMDVGGAASEEDPFTVRDGNGHISFQVRRNGSIYCPDGIRSDQEPYITCWGDSLTAMGGWTERLAALSGLPVYNGGTGGESARTIAARQGADAMLVNGITIPADCTPVVIAKSSDGGILTELGYRVTPLLQSSPHVNPCRIGDVEGTLAYDANAGQWTFTRSEAGTAVAITRPAALRTAFDISRNAPFLIILFIGQNGGYDDLDDLVRIHRLMIDHASAEHVLILGVTSGTAATRSDYELRMTQEFGRRFLNLRQYLTTPIHTTQTLPSASANILNPEGLTAGFCSPYNGALSSSDSYFVTDYLPVTGGRYLVASKDGTLTAVRFIAQFDADFNVISKSTSANGNGYASQSAYLLLDESCRYVRVSDAMYGSAALIASRKMQLELADQPVCSAYQDYEAPTVQTTVTGCYGLDDLGLTAMQDDLTAIAEGRLPPQLLTDGIHYTADTRQLIGDLIFRRCRELNIF